MKFIDYLLFAVTLMFSAIASHQTIAQPSTRLNSTATASTMTIERLNPENVYRSPSFSQMVRVSGNGDLVFISGQVGFTKALELPGNGDLRAQTVQIFENIKSLLQAVDGDLSNLVKLTIYIVDYDQEDKSVYLDVQKQYLDPNNLPTSALIGVDRLARPELLIEIEAVAVVASSL